MRAILSIATFWLPSSLDASDSNLAKIHVTVSDASKSSMRSHENDVETLRRTISDHLAFSTEQKSALGFRTVGHRIVDAEENADVLCEFQVLTSPARPKPSEQFDYMISCSFWRSETQSLLACSVCKGKAKLLERSILLPSKKTQKIHSSKYAYFSLRLLGNDQAAIIDADLKGFMRNVEFPSKASDEVSFGSSYGQMATRRRPTSDRHANVVNGWFVANKQPTKGLVHFHWTQPSPVVEMLHVPTVSVINSLGWDVCKDPSLASVVIEALPKAKSGSALYQRYISDDAVRTATFTFSVRFRATHPGSPGSQPVEWDVSGSTGSVIRSSGWGEAEQSLLNDLEGDRHLRDVLR